MGISPEGIAARSVLARAGRVKRREIWPEAVRDRQKGVFIQNRRLTGAYNFPVEIRSRAGHGYFAMGRGMVGAGKSRDEAIGALIMLVDPDVERVEAPAANRIPRESAPGAALPGVSLLLAGGRARWLRKSDARSIGDSRDANNERS